MSECDAARCLLEAKRARARGDLISAQLLLAQLREVLLVDAEGLVDEDDILRLRSDWHAYAVVAVASAAAVLASGPALADHREREHLYRVTCATFRPVAEDFLAQYDHGWVSHEDFLSLGRAMVDLLERLDGCARSAPP